jgi:L-aminopeptidase/D-esterase-like protein
MNTSATPLDLDPGSLTDVAGLSVGHATEPSRPTGCTVVLCPQGTVCGVAVRGGSPGTRETDLLRPENTVAEVHAVLLTGGSAFGLDAVTGVMRWLEERGHGLVVGPARVPIVPAAVLFDLWLGDPRIRPHAGTGHAACVAASNAPPAQGNHGAGLGATVGKLFGLARAMKGGVGTASLSLGDITVAALVVVNAIGDVLAADGSVIAGARTADGLALAHSATALLQGRGPDAHMQRMTAGMATTIGVVATNALLTKAQATQLAGLAHHGLSRTVSPISVHDGDTLFALATGKAGHAGDATVLGALAAEVVARAIRNGVRAATALADPALPAARNLSTLV